MGNAPTASESSSKLNVWAKMLAPFLVTLVILVMLVSGVGLIGIGTVATPAQAPLPTAAHAGGVSAASSHLTASSYSSSFQGLPSLAQRALWQQAAVSNANANHVPTKAFLPPDYTQTAARPSPGNGPIYVNPTPDTNPIGIGTIGVDNSTGSAVPTVFNSSSWEGQITINSASPFMINNDGPDAFGVQLNTVLHNVTVSNNSGAGIYWTQDVVEYVPSTQQLFVVDNIWNFTGASEPASTFAVGNGTATGSFYYDFFMLKGLAMPFTVDLWTNASMVPYTTQGGMGPITNWNSSVTFGLEIPGFYANNYDRVQFASLANDTAIPTPMFQVNGQKLTPIGLPSDAELILGGPGGGSSTVFYGFNGTMSLNYISTTTGLPTMAPDVWDFGFDTGETAVGVAEHYTTAGKVWMGTGPAIPTSFWGGAPGTQGTATLTTTIATGPQNMFLFLQPGSTSAVTTDGARWAPTTTGATLTWNLPPGACGVTCVTGYAGVAEYANYNPVALTYDLTNAYIQAVTLTQNFQRGVYTPLTAFSNAELNAQMWTGTDTLWNNPAPAGNLSSFYLQMNDYLFPTFAGILLDGTTVHVNVTQPAPFQVQFFSSPYWAFVITNFPYTGLQLNAVNGLEIQFYNTDYASLWGANNLNVWTSGYQAGFPDAAVVLWGASNAVVGDNVFSDMSTGLLLLNSTSPASGTNVIWGNWFSMTASGQYTTAPLGLMENEAHDTIFNNFFGTLPEAVASKSNIWSGYGQLTNDSWNLTGAAPVASTTVFSAQGFTLTGSIMGATWVCGNTWVGNTAGGSAMLPYNAGGNIQLGGDYCPGDTSGMPTYQLTFVESGLPAATVWGASICTTTQMCSLGMLSVGGTSAATASLATIAGLEPTYVEWFAMNITGFVAVPDSGSYLVGSGAPIVINYVPALLTITSPVANSAYAAPLYGFNVTWTTTGLGSFGPQLSIDIAIADSSGNVVSAKVASVVSSTTTYDESALSFAPGCYQVLVGIYNGTTPGIGEPSTPMASWPDVASQPYCVAYAYSAPSVTGVSAQAAGNVTIYYQWDSPHAMAAEFTVWQGTTAVFAPTSVWSSAGAASGTEVIGLQPQATTTYSAVVSVQTAGGSWVNSTSTFQVNPPAPPTTVSAPTWYNTTSNYYYNSTQTLPGGLAANTLGTILLEIGIVVGAVIGIMIGTMMSRKGKGGMSGGASGTGASSAAGGMFTCAACDASFPDQKALDDHRKTVHGM